MAKFKIGQLGLDLIKVSEGFYSKAYKDPIGIPTIGYGTIKVDGKPVTMGMTCTKEQAEQWLIEHIEHECGAAISTLVKVPINQEIFDSLCSFIYNLGIGNFRSSTLLKLLNAKDYEGAANQFLRWNRAGGKVYKGLTTRRNNEREIFLVGARKLNA